MAKAPVRGRKSPLLNKPTRDYERPSNEVFEPKPNFDLLTEQEKDEIRKEAAAKVEALEKDRAWQAFLDEETKRLDKELHPEAHEEMKEITLDLAIYTDRLILDGKTYLHGRTYTVKKSVYDTIMDQMMRTWKHYNDTHRDPAKALMEAQQAIAKGGAPGFAQISGSTGQTVRF